MLQTKTPPLQMKCLNKVKLSIIKAKLSIKNVCSEDSTHRQEMHWVFILTPVVTVSFLVGWGLYNLTQLSNLKTKQKTTKTGAQRMREDQGWSDCSKP